MPETAWHRWVTGALKVSLGNTEDPAEIGDHEYAVAPVSRMGSPPTPAAGVWGHEGQYLDRFGGDVATRGQQHVQRGEKAERMGKRLFEVMDDGTRIGKQEGKMGKSCLGCRRDWVGENEALMDLEVSIKSKGRCGKSARVRSSGMHGRWTWRRQKSAVPGPTPSSSRSRARMAGTEQV